MNFRLVLGFRQNQSFAIEKWESTITFSVFRIIFNYNCVYLRTNYDISIIMLN